MLDILRGQRGIANYEHVLDVLVLRRPGVVVAARDDDLAVDGHHLVVHQPGRAVDQYRDAGGAEPSHGECIVRIIHELFAVDDEADVHTAAMRMQQGGCDRLRRHCIGLHQDRPARRCDRAYHRRVGIASARQRRREADRLRSAPRTQDACAHRRKEPVQPQKSRASAIRSGSSCSVCGRRKIDHARAPSSSAGCRSFPEIVDGGRSSPTAPLAHTAFAMLDPSHSRSLDPIPFAETSPSG
jgi:hypothetical protein